MCSTKNNKYLYCANETDKGHVTAYAIDQNTYNLTKINSIDFGSATCSVALNSKDTQLAAVSYMGGDVGFFDIKSDGGLELLTEYPFFVSEDEQGELGPQKDR